MTTIDSSRITTSTSTTSQTTQKNNELGKDVFLKILTTQLRNQDPTNPMDDREFITQMAQFSMLEQISNLNQGFTNFANNQKEDISQYSNMINKEVSWVNSETGQTETGVIKGIVKKDNQFYYQINEAEIPVGDIISAKEM
ncbi:flagellar hook assembly protein FlgD [Neobacillus sp. LXY-4]|uniref:flagellar hook assembly protein FlgD n=1 Tax=Neobacillus sp. LXY-4 TaxID=3379826 RepID=UPI003EDEFEE0